MQRAGYPTRTRRIAPAARRVKHSTRRRRGAKGTACVWFGARRISCDARMMREALRAMLSWHEQHSARFSLGVKGIPCDARAARGTPCDAHVAREALRAMRVPREGLRAKPCRVKHSVRCGYGAKGIACDAILPRGAFCALFPNRTECLSWQNSDEPGAQAVYPRAHSAPWGLTAVAECATA